jgi:hypothetical protein
MENKDEKRELFGNPPGPPDARRLESQRVEGLHQKLLEAAPDAMVLWGGPGGLN